MIKHINHQNFLTTPVVAVKQWELFNGENNDVVLIEPPGSVEVSVALDYIDYSISNTPVYNGECSIALEQQDDDEIIYQEGISGSGFFDPAAEFKNYDGTFKRLVHNQTKQTFYNSYRNPTKIFGLDYIDFQSGKTERFISEFIRLFNIPQKYLGDRIVPNSVRLYDTSIDDNVSIYDDGYQNIIAGNNLFSKVQEVRKLGNILFSGSSSNLCISYLPNITYLTFTSSSILSSSIVWATSSLGSSSFNSGVYRITYLSGSYKTTSSSSYTLNGFKVVYDDGSSVKNMNLDTASLYTSSIDATIANSGSYLDFYHSGGKIGMYLYDTVYSDNVGGPILFYLNY